MEVTYTKVNVDNELNICSFEDNITNVFQGN